MSSAQPGMHALSKKANLQFACSENPHDFQNLYISGNKSMLRGWKKGVYW
jgi:hypothetical protein